MTGSETNMIESRKLKCVVVGDGETGKSSLINKYNVGIFSEYYMPTTYGSIEELDPVAVTALVEDEEYTLEIFDTPGQEEFERHRTLFYDDTDVFLVCFSVVDPISMKNVKDMWIPELKEKCGEDFKFVLVGTQTDLRNSGDRLHRLLEDGEKPVSQEQGKKLADELGVEYVECSASSNDGEVEFVFETALLTILDPRSPRTKKSKPNWKQRVQRMLGKKV